MRRQEQRPTRHPMSRAIRAALCAAALASPVIDAGLQPVLARQVSTQARVSKSVASQDFGDAPSPYPTLLSDDGARHTTGGPQLGASVDVEVDGAPSANSDGDDNDSVDDEDGITLGTARIGRADGSITINVQNGPAVLDAWVDFNGDGSWNGANERIFHGRSLSSGPTTLSFTTPADAINGNVYARFRLSSAGGLGPSGSAADGEVEDHLLALTGPAVSAGYLFDSGQTLDNADATQDVRLVDLDGDGDLDLIAVGSGPTTSAKRNKVFFNDGNGNFTDSGQVLGTEDSYGLSTGDIDGDGDIDFIVANSGQPDRVYLNDGAGNFSIGFSFTAGFSAAPLLADLDGDGDLDYFQGVLNDPNHVFLNDGSGNFTDTGQLLGNFQTLRITGGDIDGDGDIDVFEAVGESNRNNRLWINDGSGNFTEGQQFSIVRTTNAAFGDVDDDGDLDLLESTVTGTKLYLNDGTGTFGSATSLGSFETYAALLVDIDGDGDLDIIEGNYDEGLGLPNRVLLNDGSGNFSDTGQLLGMGQTHSLDAGDVDGDGDLDIVEGSYFSNNVVWLNSALDLGDAPAPYPTLLTDNGPYHGAFGPRLGATRDTELDGLPSATLAGDDLDGSDDEDGVSVLQAQIGRADGSVVVNVQDGPAQLEAWIDFNGDGSWFGATERVFINRSLTSGDNTLRFAVPPDAIDGPVAARFRLSTAGGLATTGGADDGEVEDHWLSLSAPAIADGYLIDSGQTLDNADSTQDVRLVDLDGDGDRDLIAVGSGPTTSAKRNKVFFNDGSGNFTDSGQILGTEDSYGLSTGDIDGDGDIDFVVANSGQPDRVYLNDGAGSFSIGFSFPTGFSAAPLLADLDGDGDLDYFQGVLNDPNHVFLNDGTGNFTDTGQALGNHQTLRVVGADIDGDGDIDVFEAVGESNKNNRLWINDGSGNFSEGQQFSRVRTTNATFGDVDDDGDLDLLESTVAGTKLYLNDGTGTFGSATALGSFETYAALLVDIDGDGDLDIIEGNYDEGLGLPNRVLLNDGSGNFSDTGQLLGMGQTHSLDAGDVDGDGDLDIVEGGYFSNNIVWLNDKFKVNLSVDSNSGGETDESVITITANTNAAVVGNQTVDLVVSGTQIEASDYLLSNTQILIAAGTSSGSVSFTVQNDSLFEGDETATVAINAVSSGLILGATTTQNITLIDDDSAPGLSSLQFSPASFDESASGVQLQLVRSATSAQAQCFDLSFGGSASLGADFTVADDDGATAGVQACFAAASTSTSLAISPINDGVYEGDEVISVSSDRLNANATLIDLQEAPSVAVNLSVDSNTGREADQTVVTITATIDSALVNSQTVNLSVSGSGIDPSDYALSDIQIAIASGNTTGSVTFTVQNDTLFEGDETATVAINAVSSGLVLGATTTQDITLIDDDTAPALSSLQFNPASFDESASGVQLQLVRSATSAHTQCVDLSFGGSASLGADFTVADDDGATAGVQACFSAASTSTSLAISPIDDGVYEGDEVISVSSDGLTATADLIDLQEQPPVAVNLSVDSSTGREADQTVLTITATAESALVNSQTVNLGVSGSGVEASDYLLSDTQIAIASGDTTGSVTFTVQNDSLFEGDETATLSIQSVSSGLLLGPTISQTITLIDDDATPSLTGLVFSAASFNETASGVELRVLRSAISAEDQCFDLSFTGTALYTTDYSVADGDATRAGVQACFAAASTESSAALTPIDDDLFEGDESITVSSADQSANATLIDLQSAPVTTALAFASAGFGENGGSTELQATQAPRSAFDRCIDVRVTGTAERDRDFSVSDDDAASGTQICVAAGDASGSIIFTGIDDELFEDDERVVAASGAFTAETSLIDDEPEPRVISMQFDQELIAETDRSGLYQIRLDRKAQDTRCLKIEHQGTATIDVDFVLEDQVPSVAGVQVCVAPGATAADLILMTINDDDLEGDESIIISIPLDSLDQAQTIIEDDEEKRFFRNGFD